ncbi:MAG: lipid II flippase MurJ [Candidatus Roizmanbacteria bacterium]
MLKNALFRSTVIISLFFAVDKLVGLIRQYLVIKQFGMSAVADAFNVSNNIPDWMASLVVSGLTIAIIPVFNREASKNGTKSAWILFMNISNIAVFFTSIIALIIGIFAVPIIHSPLGVAPGLNSDNQLLVIQLMQLNLIAAVIFTAGSLITAGLQANKSFLLPAIAPSFHALGQIFGVLVLAPSMGIFGLAYGVIIGAILNLLIQLPGLFHFKLRWNFRINFHQEGLREIGSLLGVRALTVFLIYLMFYIRDNMASHMQTGSISALTYAWTAVQLPETLIGTALGTALYPTISEQIASKKYGEAIKTLQNSARILIGITVPIIIFSFFLLQPILEFILPFIKIQLNIAIFTQVTLAFMVGLTGQCVLEIVARSYYAIQKQVIYLWANVGRVIIFLGISIVTINLNNPVYLALADSIAVTGMVIVLWIILIKKLHKHYQN